MSITAKSELAWKLLIELRQELREAQKLRVQVIGLKITFITAGLGFVFGIDTNPNHLMLTVPALAAIFFDFLIVSFSFSIKRIGYYCRVYLEPKIRDSSIWPDDEPLWEEAMAHKKMKQSFSNVGNVGVTVTAVIIAFIFNLPVTGYLPVGFLLVIMAVLLLFDLVFMFFYRFIIPKGKLEGWKQEGEDTQLDVNKEVT